MVNPIVYLPTTHEYFFNDRKIKSVTQIIKENGLLDDRFFTPEARERGKYIHGCCNLILTFDRSRYKFGFEHVPSIYINRVKAFVNFLSESKYESVLTETPLYSRQLDIAGKFDLVGRLNGELVLIDIKTGSPNELYERIQTMFYKLLLEENYDTYKIKKRYALYLKDDATYRLSKPFIWDTHDRMDCMSLVRVSGIREGKNGR